MSTSGGPSTAAVKADQLRNLAKLVEESRPWYEALGMTAEKASGILGEDAKDYVSEQGSGLGRKTAELLLSAADVDALKPVCIVFKALFDALKGAAKNRNDLIHLIHYGVLLVKSIPDTGTASGLSPPVKNALREFGAEVESVMQRARSFGVTQQPAAHGRLRRCLCRVRNVANHAEINEAIQHHVTNFDRIVAALGAGAAVQSAQNTEEMKARLPPRLRPKLAPVPPGLPAGEAWHAVRDHVEDEVYKILSGDEPAVAALTGRSGAGKSTAAADMVRNRKVDIRGLDDETEDQARTRMDRLERMRARFSDGVVYLRVGKGEGAADRLPDLMRKLAKALHEDVMKKIVGAPKAGEKGESYVKKMLTQKKKRCLVVADDVWEPQVIAKLKETGMFVLLTTRFPEIVEPDEVVDVDQLTPAEAEDVLRGAAELPPGQRLCDAAMEVLDDICGFVAMDIAFVGSWSTLRTADSGAWAEIVSEINDKIDDVRQGADGMDDRQVKRLAVVRTGFEYLGKEEGTLAQKLYVAIAVLPDGYAFGESDAAVLLNDTHPPVPAPHHMKVASRAIEILERWAVLTMDASGKYRMHDAHVDFARKKLMRLEDVREPVVQRWTSHISRLDVAIGFDLYVLLNMWRAVEDLGGKGCWALRPYDDQLVQMDVSHRSKSYAVNFVAELYGDDQMFGYDFKSSQLEALMQRVLKHCDDSGEDSRDVQMTALYHTSRSLARQGRFKERDDVERRMGEMIGSDFQPHLPACEDGFAQTTFHIYGFCAKAAGRLEKAEEWFQKALRVEEDGGRAASSQALSTLHALGRCAREAGRHKKAKEFYRRALEIKEEKLGANLQVAYSLYRMGGCAWEAGQLQEAEALFKQLLQKEEDELGPDHVAVAETLQYLGRCALEAERLEKAKELFQRALEIQKAKLGPNDVAVAVTLQHMGRCVRRAGLPGEAEELLRRALEIQVANLGLDDLQVAYTLHELGLCVGRLGGYEGEEEALFQRALKIKEANLGRDDVEVASTLGEMGRCVRRAGRVEDAGTLFQRALEITKAKLEPNDVAVATLEEEMRWCRDMKTGDKLDEWEEASEGSVY